MANLPLDDESLEGFGLLTANGVHAPADKMAEASHPFKHVEVDAGQLREHVPIK